MDLKTLKLYNGDCLKVLKTIPSNSVHSVVTDPPYGIAFDKAEWDDFGGSKGYQKWCQEWAYQCLRILRPGGYLIAFSASRMYHRLVCGVEDAGFKIKNTINWLYSSGTPKCLNFGMRDSRLKGWSTDLKPAFEPAVLAQKPFSEKTVIEQFIKSRTGAINIDGCRFPYGDECWFGPNHDCSGKWDKPVHSNMVKGGNFRNKGRRALIDSRAYKPVGGRWPANVFVCKKPQKKEKNFGFGHEGTEFTINPHPTVKPLKLIKWMVRLVTAEGGTVVDPFMGSGTTAVAAALQGFKCIGIEKDPLFYKAIMDRMTWIEGKLEEKGKL